MPSPLLACPAIGSHCIHRCDENRSLLVDTSLIRFTPTEYRLLVPLLEGRPISDNDLAQYAFCSKIEHFVRGNLDKHMDKIRFKIRPVGLDVYRVTKYGYILLDDVQTSGQAFLP